MSVLYLRHEPTSLEVKDRLKQVRSCIRIMESLRDLQPNAAICCQVLSDLCREDFEGDMPCASTALASDATDQTVHQQTANISNTQITHLYQMMWSHDPASQDEPLLENDGWMAAFLDDMQGHDDMS